MDITLYDELEWAAFVTTIVKFPCEDWQGDIIAIITKAAERIAFLEKELGISDGKMKCKLGWGHSQIIDKSKVIKSYD